MKGPRHLALRLARWDESEGALGRHSLLLGSLVMLLVALPLTQILSGGDVRFVILLALVLIAAVYVNFPQRWTSLAATLLGLGAIVGLAVAAMTGSWLLRIISDGLALGLLGFTTLLMLNSLIHARRVAPDTIVGGICVYLLIGLCFAMTFGLICDLAPGSIADNGVAIKRSLTGETSQATKLLYFSFVTLTTLGYGDITPVSEIAQMLAVGEAMIGQIYLTIFLARLVALYVASDRRRPRLRTKDPDLDEDE